MAEVRVIYLPAGEGGTKQGVDDFLAAGHSVGDLLSLATAELREPPRADDEDETLPIPYRETRHGLVHDRQTQHGTVSAPLTNFTARIVGDVVEDDGAEERRSFEIEADLNGRRSSFAVPAERFAPMGWPAEHLGAGAVVYAGFGTKDHARTAIQVLSGDVPIRRVYNHTGWRNVDGAWVYLHAGGAIGPEGPFEGVEVSLRGRLSDYALPAPPAGEGLARAVEASLRFLELAPPEVVVPLLAAAYRAPLGEVVPVDLSVFVAGPTGAFKTELTAIAQAHFGAAFNGRRLPANWSSTENALERVAFATKDAVVVVDDFAPTGTTADVARLHRTADRFLRGAGNRSGRGRMRADTTLRAEYYPRGLVLSSGEDVPRGQSLRARMMTVEASPGDVVLDVLTELQRAAEEGVLASATAGFVRWLAPRMDDFKGRLPDYQRNLRVRAAGAGAHARTPDTVASLFLGIETFLGFAADAGAVTATRADELRDAAWQALGKAAAAQAEHQAGEEPTRRFLELLTSAIAGGDAHLASAETGEEPEDHGRWGWRLGPDGPLPRGRRVGWLDPADGSPLLEPGAAFAAAQKMAREQGTGLPIGQQTLWKRMAEKGLLASRETKRGRNTVRKTVAGERKAVIHLIPGLLSSNGPIGPSDPTPGKRGGLGPKVRAVSASALGETARRNGPGAAGTGPPGPKGPLGPVPDGEGASGEKPGTSRCLPDAEPVFVSTPAGVEALLPELRVAGRVGLDLETTGLDPRQDRIRLLTLATDRGVWLVDCFEVDPRPLLPVLAEKTLVIHNALFDVGFLSRMGFEVGGNGRVLDTMLLSQLLAEGREDEEDA